MGLRGRRVGGYDPTITDLHTRKLRYFIAVAEELHFSRAAARLFLAQQALSRQIRELEEELGIQLFIRSTRKVELTAAGEAFLSGARTALEALDRATAMALRVNRSLTGTLRLGFFPGAALELTEPIVTEFRSAYPDVTLEMRESLVTQPTAGIVDGSADISIVRLPMDTEGLETVSLFDEPLVVAVSVGHRLAQHKEVDVHELLDETMTLSDTADPVYRSFWVLDEFRAGKPAMIMVTRSVTEEASLVATGGAVAITAAAAKRYVPHPGIRFIPLSGAPRSTVALAWRAGDTSALVQRFVETAVKVRDRETGIVELIGDPDRLVDPA